MFILKENQQNLMISVMNTNEKESLSKEPTSYMNNMMLPEMVKATRNQPLGPDCIIATTEVTDQAVLKKVDYYWYISHEKGCVECAVKPLIPKTAFIQSDVVASDPRCVITRKHRRFEAYCCMICRANFVTVVQALLHLKALHRRNNNILIQDKDVFQNIDKAMEVPPVPLPWHIAKRTIAEDELSVQITTETPTFVIPPGSLAVNSPIKADVKTTGTLNDMLDKALNDSTEEIPTTVSKNVVPTQQHQTKEINNFNSNSDSPDFRNPVISIISALKEKCGKKITALTFNTDSSQVLVKFEDGEEITATTPDLAEGNNSDSDEEVDMNETLSFTAIKSDKDSSSSFTLKANNKALARKLFLKAKGIVVENNTEVKQASNKKIKKISTENDPVKEVNSPVVSVTAESQPIVKPSNRPLKSVRFMLGAPDSSDDERPTTPRKSVSPILSKNEKNETTKETDFKGLQSVVADLITTASKGRIAALPSTPPLTTSLTTFTSTPGLHTTGSTPDISKLILEETPENETPITRVQSWSSSTVGGTAFSVASMRRPYIARGFTYAEKIELMKQKNDYDSDFTTNHILKTSATTSITRTKPRSTKIISSSQASVKTVPSTKKRVRKSKYSTDPISTLPISSGIDTMTFGNLSSKKDTSPTPDLDSILSSAGKSFHDDDPGDVDSDEGPPTLLTSLGATAAAYSGLLQQGLLSANNFPSSDYYGSGEWASAAMETLKRLQEENIGTQLKNLNDSNSSNNLGKMVIKQEKEFDDVGNFYHSDDSVKSEDKRSLSDDVSSQKPAQLKVKFSRKRSKPKEQQNRASSASPTKRRKNEMSQEFQPVSDVIPTIKVHDLDRSVARPVARYLEETMKSSKLRSKRVNNLINSLGAKSSSEPNLVARVKEELPKMPARRETVAAKSGDSLVFLDDVTMTSFMNHNSVMTRLQQSQPNSTKEKSDLSNPSSSFSNMPEVFRNCIDTHFRVQLIRKMHVCKVCGFSVDAPSNNDSGNDVTHDDVSMDKALRDHVMEHSLKELYDIGYDMAGTW